MTVIIFFLYKDTEISKDTLIVKVILEVLWMCQCCSHLETALCTDRQPVLFVTGVCFRPSWNLGLCRRQSHTPRACAESQVCWYPGHHCEWLIASQLTVHDGHGDTINHWGARMQWDVQGVISMSAYPQGGLAAFRFGYVTSAHSPWVHSHRITLPLKRLGATAWPTAHQSPCKDRLEFLLSICELRLT